MPKIFEGRIDLRGNEALNISFERLDSYPAESTVSRVFYHIGERALKFCIDATDTSEPSSWATVSDDLFNKRGSLSVVRDASGRITESHTSLPGGLTRISVYTRDANGNISSIATSIPALGVYGTDTIIRDADGKVSEISVT